MLSLLLELTVRMCVISTSAFLFSRIPVFKRVLGQMASGRDKAIITVGFGIFTLLGTYFGIEVKGAIANSRAVGAVVAGLIGGPWVGLGAGAIAGLHRWALGGFTGFACGLSTTLEGLLGGLVATRVRKVDWEVALATGFVAELMQMGILLLVAKPFSASLELVKMIAVPMTLVNGAGVAIFITMLHSLQAEMERVGAVQTQKVLEIARLSLPHLKRGLTPRSAMYTARIILELTGVDAVAFTDREKVLSHVGIGADHHLPGYPFLTRATARVLEEGSLEVAQTKDDIGCNRPDCPLGSGVIVPLYCQNRIIGTLKLYRARPEGITPVDMEVASGLSQLFSTQLELAEASRRAELAAQAELTALQAQINPHFLFNAINTIVSFCRTDPNTARRLLLDLAAYFRRNLERAGHFCTLEEELAHVHAYLALEQARFGSKLKLVEEVPPELKEVRLPRLTLEPLVENAVKHGIAPLPEGGTVLIRAQRRPEGVHFTVADSGVGMKAATLAEVLRGCPASGGIGICNVAERLKSIYGSEYGLKIESAPGKGTRVSFFIPAEVEVHERLYAS
ncbi:MAG: two-component system, LytTR family, sensor histidine kinase LytS [Bacillota bacterium]|nr:two-component system, LytTR family, sensor histidine kinase LytS [Bacillota bacterium]